MEKNKGAKLALQLLISIDQFLHVLIWGLFYMLHLAEKPIADETISSKVGRYAIQGYRWALIAEKGINFIFALLGDEDHCRKRIEWEEVAKP